MDFRKNGVIKNMLNYLQEKDHFRTVNQGLVEHPLDTGNQWQNPLPTRYSRRQPDVFDPTSWRSSSLWRMMTES